MPGFYRRVDSNNKGLALSEWDPWMLLYVMLLYVGLWESAGALIACSRVPREALAVN